MDTTNKLRSGARWTSGTPAFGDTRSPPEVGSSRSSWRSIHCSVYGLPGSAAICRESRCPRSGERSGGGLLDIVANIAGQRLPRIELFLALHRARAVRCVRALSVNSHRAFTGIILLLLRTGYPGRYSFLQISQIKRIRTTVSRGYTAFPNQGRCGHAVWTYGRRGCTKPAPRHC